MLSKVAFQWRFLLIFQMVFFVVIAFADDRVKIGVSVPLTGGAATYGVDIKNGLEFANERLSGGKYEFIFEDDRCNGKDATIVAHKLTKNQDV